MVWPAILSRMKEWCHFAGVGVNAAEVRAFVTFTFRAGEHEMLGVIRAAMLSGDDVLDVETQAGEFLR